MKSYKILTKVEIIIVAKSKEDALKEAFEQEFKMIDYMEFVDSSEIEEKKQ